MRYYHPKRIRLAAVLFLTSLFCGDGLIARSPVSRFLEDSYYPQKPHGELVLNYYYDRTGRWVKFSDWIPFQQKKFQPVFLEDFYAMYSLPMGYRTAELKESIFYLYQGMQHKFRHPRNSLCDIKTEAEFHKYRLLMFMHINMLIMRMHLRLGSQFDKRHLYFHDLDMADDLEISFLIARTYYKEAHKFWLEAKKYADKAHVYPFELDLPTIESERFEIATGELDYDKIINRHLGRVDAKLKMTAAFLDKEGRPRPVKKAIQKDMESMYDETFKPGLIGKPELDPEWNEKPLFDDNFWAEEKNENRK